MSDVIIKLENDEKLEELSRIIDSMLKLQSKWHYDCVNGILPDILAPNKNPHAADKVKYQKLYNDNYIPLMKNTILERVKEECRFEANTIAKMKLAIQTPQALHFKQEGNVKKIAFVGAGQVGSVLAAKLSQGLDVDLVEIIGADQDRVDDLIDPVIIASRGSGRIFDVGKETAKSKEKEIAQAISHIENTLVYLIWASGGGTGSGMSELILKKLLAQNNKVEMVTVLPATKLHDGPRSWSNAAKSMSAILEYTKATIEKRPGLLVIPNEYLTEAAGTYPEDSEPLRTRVNIVLANIFDTFFNFASRITPNARSNYTIDKNEYVTFKNEKGLYGFRIVPIPDIVKPPQELLIPGGPELTVRGLRLRNARSILVSICIPNTWFGTDKALAAERVLERLMSVITGQNNPDGRTAARLERRNIISGLTESPDGIARAVIFAAGCNPETMVNNLVTDKKDNEAIMASKKQMLNKKRKIKDPITGVEKSVEEFLGEVKEDLEGIVPD